MASDGNQLLQFWFVTIRQQVWWLETSHNAASRNLSNNHLIFVCQCGDGDLFIISNLDVFYRKVFKSPLLCFHSSISTKDKNHEVYHFNCKTEWLSIEYIYRVTGWAVRTNHASFWGSKTFLLFRVSWVLHFLLLYPMWWIKSHHNEKT